MKLLKNLTSSSPTRITANNPQNRRKPVIFLQAFLYTIYSFNYYKNNLLIAVIQYKNLICQFIDNFKINYELNTNHLKISYSYNYSN